jgi:hypothetical protein
MNGAHPAEAWNMPSSSCRANMAIAPAPGPMKATCRSARMPAEAMGEHGQEHCAVCGWIIEGGRGYAQLWYKERMYALCSPLCLATLEKQILRVEKGKVDSSGRPES